MQQDFYVILTEDGVDQVAQAKANMQREVRDLTRMGCTVRAHGPFTGTQADAFVDNFETFNSVARALRHARSVG